MRTATRFLQQACTAVLADIVPGRDPAIVQPRDDDRLLQSVPNDKIARGGEIDRRKGREPGVVKNRLHLALEQVGVGVIGCIDLARRQGVLLFGRRRKGARGFGVEMRYLISGKVGHGCLVKAVGHVVSAPRRRHIIAASRIFCGRPVEVIGTSSAARNITWRGTL